MDAFDAQARVGEQVFAVALADQAAEQIEIAAEVENIRIGSQDDVRDMGGGLGRVPCDAINGFLRELAHLVHQLR